jgi:hypothetical protein
MKTRPEGPKYRGWLGGKVVTLPRAAQRSPIRNAGIGWEGGGALYLIADTVMMAE